MSRHVKEVENFKTVAIYVISAFSFETFFFSFHELSGLRAGMEFLNNILKTMTTATENCLPDTLLHFEIKILHFFFFFGKGCSYFQISEKGDVLIISGYVLYARFSREYRGLNRWESLCIAYEATPCSSLVPVIM